MGLGADMEQMEHGDRPTCGEGLAANAVLPAKLAELMAAQAEVLERHTRALDSTDAAARKEFDAYAKLERAHRDVASELANLAEEMASYRELPMGRHHARVFLEDTPPLPNALGPGFPPASFFCARRGGKQK